MLVGSKLKLTIASAISACGMGLAAPALAQAPTSLSQGVADAWKRGCLTELMGMTERATAAGMGPTAFGIEASAPPSALIQAQLAQGLPAKFSKLETEKGTIWLASVQAKQPLCVVAVYDSDPTEAAPGLLATLGPPWALKSHNASAAEYVWKAPGRPTILVNISGPGLGSMALGTGEKAPPRSAGLSLLILSTVMDE